MSNLLVNDKIARIPDMLEQVERLNEMVDFHKSKCGEPSVRRQEFLEELTGLLAGFRTNHVMAAFGCQGGVEVAKFQGRRGWSRLEKKRFG
jgi:hypothetical protein